ncbi:MAG: hypothetical protein KAJ51_03780, partial [Thermoplasmata archaeon]|nr:hypothetical protein [Thermoplasmata archaeon]
QIMCTQGGGGSGTGYGENGQSGIDALIKFKCKKLYVDEYKDIEGESTWFDETTYLISSVESITIDAPTEAKLWVPNFGKNEDFKLPSAATGTTIELYHTLQVTVISNTGDKLKDAPVEVKLGDSTEVKNSDANGIVFFLKPAYKITRSSQGDQVWSVTADYSGAKGSYPGGVTLPKRHNEIEVKVTLITVSIDTIKFANKLYSALDMVVYGLVTIEGTTAGPNPVKSVEVKIGSISAAAMDISGSEPEFTKWSYVWDTRTETPGAKFKVEAVATDENGFSDNGFINLTVAQTPVPPIVTVLEPENNLEFKDRIGSPGLVIKGTVYDPNWDSKLLEHSKNVMKV